MFVFQLGAAFKPSLLDGEPLPKLRFYAETMSRLGYRYLVIDSETEKTDIAVSEFEELVEFCRGLGYPEPVLTVPVRRGDASRRLAESSEVVGSKGFGGVCLVAGNPVYLSPDESRNNAARSLYSSAEYFRNVSPFGLLMVGTEHVVKPAAKISERFKAIPVMLLTPTTYIEVKTYDNGVSKALYAPFYIGETIPEHVHARIKAYVSRRNSVSAAQNPFDSYVLVGGLQTVAERIRGITGSEVDVFIGFPVDNELKQLSALKTAAG
ncbi:MAG: hypothetical protein NZ956_02210 [Candidatus Caldarchaeum sp.]|nr:hypothetical protein [Candidatus Caldarchaeum sp.]